MKLFSILESNVQEALELGIAKDYAEHIRRPETEKVIDNLLSNLKKQGTFTGKESKRGERVYFNYEGGKDNTENFSSRTMGVLEHILSNNSDLFQELFGKTYSIESGKDYLDGLATDSRGQKVGIGKLLNMTVEKLKKKGDEQSLKFVQTFEYNKRLFQEDEQRNAAISGKNKKRYIVISKANYDIAGMTTGRSWSSCMALTSGNGQKFIHCDIKEGTLIAYLINEDDTNIQRPIARVLIKPFISTSNYKDYLYVVEANEYGTAPGFVQAVQDMFREAQPGKEGRYKLNRKLYADSEDEVRVRKRIEVINQEVFDKIKLSDNETTDTVDVNFFSLDEVNANPRDVKKVENIKTSVSIKINNLDYITEVSNIETDNIFRVRQLTRLAKISNIKCKEMAVSECAKVELLENISTEDLDIYAYGYGDQGNSKISIKKITGDVKTIYINKIDQESLDNLDLSSLTLERISFSFSGESINKFADSLGEVRTISVRDCDNLKELPKKIGTYERVLFLIPNEIKDKLQVPEGANYKVL